jgi:uncharacterized protein (TIGR03083 family)
MMTVPVQVNEIRPLGHDEAMKLAEAEYERMRQLLVELSPDDWSQPTDCDRWDVKGIVSHIVGINEGVLNPLEMQRQARAGKRFHSELGLSKFDAGNEVQVVERAHLSGREVRQAYEQVVPRILRRRTRFPVTLRWLPIPDGMGGRFKISYLMDIVLTRDIWMHRVDISRATNRHLVLTPEHDGRIVADVVADWAARHRAPFHLTLDGPAGGEFVNGDGGEEHRLEAVEFCRVLSGRAAGEGILKTFVPF